MKKSTYVFIANLLVLALVSLVWFIGSDYFPNSPFSLALSGSFGFESSLFRFAVFRVGILTWNYVKLKTFNLFRLIMHKPQSNYS